MSEYSLKYYTNLTYFQNFLKINIDNMCMPSLLTVTLFTHVIDLTAKSLGARAHRARLAEASCIVLPNRLPM
jgi:hypothetical protein